MLHSFKKGMAKQTAPVRGINPGGEFLDYKKRLVNVKKNLQYIDRRMEDAMKYWNVHVVQQRNLSERFSNGYPISGDETDLIAKEFQRGSTAVYDYFLRSVESGEEPYKNMHAQVKAYIKEIVDVEKQYRELIYIKSEAERYQAKVDNLDRRGKRNDLKRTRNLHKMDQEKEKLASKAKIVLAAQKEAYAKAPTIYKAALCSYWSAHERHTEVMMENMVETSIFARNAEEELGNLDISQMFLVAADEEELTTDENAGSNETNSAEDSAMYRCRFGKVPSVMPKSPGRSSTSEGDLEFGEEMEMQKDFRKVIAV